MADPQATEPMREPGAVTTGRDRGASTSRAEAREGDLLIVDLERFQGPLDLLLHLIRTQDIDIFDIPIARITRQFLEAIEALQAGALDEAGEFLEMAAGLVRIKAQMLLPRTGDDEDEDPRAELVRRLLEYEQVREIAQRLRAAENDRSRRFGKGFVPARPRARKTDAPLETTWDDVFQAALQVELPTPQDLEHRITTRPVAMSEKVHLIIRTLKRVQRIEFSRLVGPWRERIHGVMTLLAGLELGRRRVVTLRQSRPFSELWIYKHANLEDEALVADIDAGELELGTGADGAPEEIRP